MGYQLRFLLLGNVSALLFLVILSLNLYAQRSWKPVNIGLQGSPVASLNFNAEGVPLIGAGRGTYILDALKSNEFDTDYWRLVDSTIYPLQIERSPDGTLYAGTIRGLFRSIDDGEHWEQIVEEPVAEFALLGNARLLWFVRGVGQFFYSTDDGKTVVSVPSPYPLVVIQQDRSGVPYLIRPGNVVYKFLESTRTWKKMEFPQFKDSPFKKLFPVHRDTLIAMNEMGIYHTTNNGTHWELVNSIQVVEVVRGEDDNLYGLVEGYRAYLNDRLPLLQSTDGGLTWEKHGTYMPGLLEVSSDGVLWNGAYRTLYVSENSGSTWLELSEGLTSVHVSGIAYDRTDESMYLTLFRDNALTFSGVVAQQSLHRSTNSGGQWELIRDGISHYIGHDTLGNLYITVDSLGEKRAPSFVPDSIYSRLFRSDDGGDSWNEIIVELDKSLPIVRAQIFSSPSGITLLDITCRDMNLLPVERDFHTLFLSTDSGGTWRQMNSWPSDEGHQIDASYVTAKGSVLFSSHRTNERLTSKTWRYEPITGRLTQVSSTGASEFVAAPDGRVYSYDALGFGAGLSYSDNDGISWKTVDLPSGSRRLSGLKVNPDGDLFFTNNSRFDTLFRSTNRGKSWVPLTRRLPGIRHFISQVPALLWKDGVLFDTIHFDREHPLYPGSSFHYYGFGWSIDNGDTWQYDTGDLDFKHTSAILLTDKEELFVGTTYFGAYRLQSSLSVPDQHQSILLGESFNLFPMPIVDYGTVYFLLENSTSVHLELFDPLGRSVKVMADDEMEAGEHRLPVDVSGIASGSYFLRLTSGEMRETVPVLVQ